MPFKTFVLAEKPDAGAQLAYSLPDSGFNDSIEDLKQLGKRQGYLESNNYIICWAAGHLFTTIKPKDIDPSYGLFQPFDDLKLYRMEGLLNGFKSIPSDDPYKLKLLSCIKKQINRKDINLILNATDSDAEAESIFRDILDFCLENKNIPVKRFWNQYSFKQKEPVLEAMNNLLPYDDTKYQNLFYSQRARACSDYLLGMKISKLNVEQYNKPFYCGRVKGVVLGLIGNRQIEIDNFKSSKYWSVYANSMNVEFRHFFSSSDDESTLSDIEDVDDNEDGGSEKKERYYFNIDQVNKIKSDLSENSEAKVISFKTVSTTSKTRPLPLSGTDFGIEMLNDFNMSLAEAESILIYLREEGFIGYQGTNGRVYSLLDENEVRTAFDACCSYFSKSPEFTTDTYIFNDKKAAKQNHPPLTPTGKIPTVKDFEKWKSAKDMKGKLISNVKEGYELIAKRILVAFLEDDEIEKQSLIVASVNHNHMFDLTGQKAITQGWRSFINKEITDTTFSLDKPLEEGDILNFESIHEKESNTKAPPLYTGATLLKTLSNISSVVSKLIKDTVDPAQITKLKKISKLLKNAEGIGTDRTRESIISDLENLPAIQFNSKKQYVLTELGLELFHVYPPTVKSIIMSADLEDSLEQIRRGELDYKKFLSDLDNMIMDEMIPYVIKNVGLKVSPKIIKNDLINSVCCPVCESRIYEKDNSYTCEKSNYKDGQQLGCKFSIGKNNFSKTLGKRLEGENDIVSLINSTKDNVFKLEKHGVYLDLESDYFTSVVWDQETSDSELQVTPKTYKLGKKFIFKNYRSKDLTISQAMKILSGKKVKVTRKSKEGKTYKLELIIKGEGPEILGEFAK